MGFLMPMTAFGLACRQLRANMKVVMADQSKATGVPCSSISAIERGLIGLPEGYLDQLVEWMQLTEAEEAELRRHSVANQASLRKPKKRGHPERDGELINILNSLTSRKENIT
ncbi:hypothetical protein [Bradyrhizobium sp.]|uniref:hypothetical protein n=1 Tax=Bradyrhizobium sp. TaxID=376 RepID=UPI0040383F9E